MVIRVIRHNTNRYLNIRKKDKNKKAGCKPCLFVSKNNIKTTIGFGFYSSVSELPINSGIVKSSP